MERQLLQPEVWNWGEIRKDVIENGQPELNVEDEVPFHQVKEGVGEGNGRNKDRKRQKENTPKR